MFGIKKLLGFGMMRLPEKDGEPDYEKINEMVDHFQAEGFNYYDTARLYHGGKSEIAVRECVAKRYPREEFVLCDKLSVNYFENREDIRPLFESQLEACGVDYFDVYLMHSQTKDIYAKFRRCNAYEEAIKLKEEGKFKHLGISFHDTPELLEEILTAYPQIEVVQIQFNYVDYEDTSVQSKRCYEVCRKFGKPVFIMEPVRGGSLAKLPEKAVNLLTEGSPASYAIRFAAGFEGVAAVLSGMGNMDMVKDNTSYMKDFKPLTEEELKRVFLVRDVMKNSETIPCTACRYCVETCPKNISIPDLFACYNGKQLIDDWNAGWYYKHVHTVDNGKASDCIKCGVCESLCPQHLKITELLETVAKTFEG